MSIWDLKKTFSPWIDIVIHDFSESFPQDYRAGTLKLLHQNIEVEIEKILKSDNGGQAEVLFATLTYIYNHFCWKLNQKKEFPNVKTSCVKLLSQLVKTGLILSKGNVSSEWIAKVLMALKLFPGVNYQLYETLLLVNFLKKKYHRTYAACLKQILCTEEQEAISDPLVYMELILLYRRLKSLIKSPAKKASVISYVVKMKPPPNLISWLLSLNIPEMCELKYKTVAKQLIRNKVPEDLFKKILMMALHRYSFKDDIVENELSFKESENMSAVNSSLLNANSGTFGKNICIEDGSVDVEEITSMYVDSKINQKEVNANQKENSLLSVDKVSSIKNSCHKNKLKTSVEGKNSESMSVGERDCVSPSKQTTSKSNDKNDSEIEVIKEVESDCVSLSKQSANKSGDKNDSEIEIIKEVESDCVSPSKQSANKSGDKNDSEIEIIKEVESDFSSESDMPQLQLNSDHYSSWIDNSNNSISETVKTPSLLEKHNRPKRVSEEYISTSGSSTSLNSNVRLKKQLKKSNLSNNSDLNFHSKEIANSKLGKDSNSMLSSKKRKSSVSVSVNNDYTQKHSKGSPVDKFSPKKVKYSLERNVLASKFSPIQNQSPRKVEYCLETDPMDDDVIQISDCHNNLQENSKIISMDGIIELGVSNSTNSLGAETMSEFKECEKNLGLGSCADLCNKSAESSGKKSRHLSSNEVQLLENPVCEVVASDSDDTSEICEFNANRNNISSNKTVLPNDSISVRNTSNSNVNEVQVIENSNSCSEIILNNALDANNKNFSSVNFSNCELKKAFDSDIEIIHRKDDCKSNKKNNTLSVQNHKLSKKSSPKKKSFKDGSLNSCIKCRMLSLHRSPENNKLSYSDCIVSPSAIANSLIDKNTNCTEHDTSDSDVIVTGIVSPRCIAKNERLCNNCLLNSQPSCSRSMDNSNVCQNLLPILNKHSEPCKTPTYRSESLTPPPSDEHSPRSLPSPQLVSSNSSPPKISSVGKEINELDAEKLIEPEKLNVSNESAIKTSDLEVMDEAPKLSSDCNIVFPNENKKYLSFSDMSTNQRCNAHTTAVSNDSHTEPQTTFTSYRSEYNENIISVKDDGSTRSEELSDDVKSKSSSAASDGGSDNLDTDELLKAGDSPSESTLPEMENFENSPFKNKRSIVVLKKCRMDEVICSDSKPSSEKSVEAVDCDTFTTNSNVFSMTLRKSKTLDSNIIDKNTDTKITRHIAAKIHQNEKKISDTEVLSYVREDIHDKQSSVSVDSNSVESDCASKCLQYLDSKNKIAEKNNKSSKKASSGKSKHSKDNSFDGSLSKRYSLRQKRKSTVKTDSSSNLGIDISRLSIQSPSSEARNSRVTRSSYIINQDISKKDDTTGYSLRTRKSILAPSKLKF